MSAAADTCVDTMPVTPIEEPLMRTAHPPLLLLDLDNTVVDRVAAVASWAEAMSRRWADGHPEVTRWLIEADQDGMRHPQEVALALRTRFGLAGTVEQLAAEMAVEISRRSPALSPEVVDLLAGFRDRGWRIGVVTNGLADIQLATLTHVGLDRLVHGWAISGAEGVRKPDRALFDIAATRAGSSVDSAVGWMVGDNAHHDIGGGSAIGLRTVWLHRGRDWPAPAAHRPTHVADGVAHALRLVAQASAAG